MSRNRFIQLVGLATALGLSACAQSPLEPRAGYCSWGESPATGCLEWVPEAEPDTLIWEAVSQRSQASSESPRGADLTRRIRVK